MSITLEEKAIASQIADGVLFELKEDGKLDLNKLKTLRDAASGSGPSILKLGLNDQKIAINVTVAKRALLDINSDEYARKIIDAVSTAL